jgi:hypothetical protein
VAHWGGEHTHHFKIAIGTRTVEPRVFLLSFPDYVLMFDAKDQLFSDWRARIRALRPMAQ